MEGIAGEIIKGFGEGLGGGIVMAILLVIVAVLLSIITAVIFGIVFFLIAFIFYKAGKKPPFLVFGILGSFFSSFGLAVVFSSLLVRDLSPVIWLTPILFLVGLFFVIKKSKKIS